MVMQLLEGSPLADETDYLLWFHYLRTRDYIDPIIEENGSEGSRGTDQGDKTSLALHQEVLQGVIDKSCPCNPYDITLGKDFLGRFFRKIPF